VTYEHRGSAYHVRCPKCRRRRLVGERSRAAVQARRGDVDHTALVCITCRLLASVDAHQAAIRELHKRIEERRMRGL
jgi:hypothetical protein